MATLLIVHHTPSPWSQAMLEAARDGAGNDEIEGVDVVVRPALAADAYLLGTPANIGYMSGALKHFFDTVYYPVLEATVKRPYGLYVHGNEGVEGAVRAVESIASGLQWQPAAEPVTVMGEPCKADLEACWELGATIAVSVAE
jgi:NAD(P)H-dependent FMN reductase